MAINEDHRQADIAVELEETARSLAHSTRAVLVPSDSYRLLGELNATTDHLAQVCQQLAAWHDRVEEGTHYEGEDDRGDGATGTVAAAEQLRQAASALSEATQALMAAHSASGVVRWYDAPRE